MPRPSLIILCVAAFVAAALAAPPPDSGPKKDELSNDIPQSDGESATTAGPKSDKPEEGVTSTSAPTTLTVASTEERRPTKPHDKGHVQPPGAGFAQLIDDIFQIPISVLKAVNTLIANPFRSRPSGGHKAHS